jgi:DNA mismatch repair protein MutS2
VNTRLDNELQPTKVTKKKNKEAIVVGDTVYINKLNIYGKVLSIHEKKQEVEIQTGQVTLKLRTATVEKAESGADVQPGVKSKVVLPEIRPIQSRFDLRGKRADEIEILLDGYLNDATLANLSEVQIIHGIATGTVRQIVRDFLAGHPLVKSFSSGSKDQGGDGVTMVCL